MLEPETFRAHIGRRTALKRRRIVRNTHAQTAPGRAGVAARERIVISPCRFPQLYCISHPLSFCCSVLVCLRLFALLSVVCSSALLCLAVVCSSALLCVTGLSLAEKHLVTEARQILNIDKTDITDPVELKNLINKNYEALYLANEVPKGGSFYLQSKLYRAKEVMEGEFVRKYRISLAPNAPNVPGQIPKKPSVLGWFSSSPSTSAPKPSQPIGPQLPPDQQPPTA